MIINEKNHLRLMLLLSMIMSQGICCDSIIDTIGCQFYVKSKNDDCKTFDFEYC